MGTRRGSGVRLGWPPGIDSASHAGGLDVDARLRLWWFPKGRAGSPLAVSSGAGTAELEVRCSGRVDARRAFREEPHSSQARSARGRAPDLGRPRRTRRCSPGCRSRSGGGSEPTSRRPSRAGPAQRSWRAPSAGRPVAPRRPAHRERADARRRAAASMRGRRRPRGAIAFGPRSIRTHFASRIAPTSPLRGDSRATQPRRHHMPAARMPYHVGERKCIAGSPRVGIEARRAPPPWATVGRRIMMDADRW